MVNIAVIALIIALTLTPAVVISFVVAMTAVPEFETIAASNTESITAIEDRLNAYDDILANIAATDDTELGN